MPHPPAGTRGLEQLCMRADDVYRINVALVIAVLRILAAWRYDTLRPTNLIRFEVLDGDAKRHFFLFDPLPFNLKRDQMPT
jgi:hypothetical protein